MEEKDMKPSEASQAEPLFELDIDQHYTSNDNGELHEEKDLDHSKQEMASCNTQQGIEECSCTQAIIDLKLYDRRAGELLPQLKLSDAAKDKCIKECKEDAQTVKIEPENHLIVGQLSEFHGVQEQLLHLMDELKTVNKELLHVKSELTAAEEPKVAALRQADLFEAALVVEKEKNKKLLMHISELNDIILSSNVAAIKAEEERTAFFRGIDAELQIAAVAVSQSQQQLEETKEQLNTTRDLENKLMEKTRIIESLQLELSHSIFLQNSSTNTINDLNQLKSDIEVIERKNAEKLCYTMSIETEMKKKEEELQCSREKINDLNLQIEVIANEMQNLKIEASKSTDRELQFQVEIATLRSELHKGRSRIAAAEAAKIRAMSSQAGLYLAVQQLAVEAEAAKNEARRLKQEIDDCGVKIKKEDDKSREKSEDEFITASTGFCSPESLVPKFETPDAFSDEPPNDGCQSRSETQMLKEKLEAANAEISDLRFHLEEAVRRLELAEKAKESIEEKHRKWKEKQQQRRAASEARREQTARRYGIVTANDKPRLYHQTVSNTNFSALPDHEERNPPMYDGKDPKLVTLGMILNIKL